MKLRYGSSLTPLCQRRSTSLRRRVSVERKQELIGCELEILQPLGQPDLVAHIDDVQDCVLRLGLMNCHPVLPGRLGRLCDLDETEADDHDREEQHREHGGGDT
jgi:hypothetical protein